MVVLALAAALPVMTLGPGTDLDVGVVLQSGELIMDGDYRPSRPPGAPVHETLVGVLNTLGGTFLTNVLSLAAAVAVLAALVRLALDENLSRPVLVASIVAANPWFVVAATSTVDFPLALALFLWGVIAQRADRWPVAAGLFAVAAGCRVTTLLLVLAALVADMVGTDARPRRALRIGAATSVITGALFIPAYLSAGKSLAFAQNDFRTAGFFVMVGRALSKDLYFFGPWGAIVGAVMLPALLVGLRHWRARWILRFGVLGVVVMQLLFFRFPWKMGHLLPLLACLALWIGVTLNDRPRWLMALVAAQALYGVVNLQLIEPNNPNDASSGRATFDLRWGVVATDVACRADDPDAGTDNDRTRLEAVWNCAKPFGTGP